jgi:catechol 2,3-dioxygenase
MRESSMIEQIEVLLQEECAMCFFQLHQVQDTKKGEGFRIADPALRRHNMFNFKEPDSGPRLQNPGPVAFQYLSFMNYTIPRDTRIGHVHLKVSDIDKSLKFYCELLGFELQQMYGASAAFISAGGYHHHIGLNTWHSKGSEPAPGHYPGLYHTAILYPTRKDLAIIFKRLVEAKYPITGASDHGVSEAIYLDDPDGNGVELYWDRPKEEWPLNDKGELLMKTDPLDLHALIALAS